ncbi:MAG: hypothetical protein C4326_09795 [Ignavibacteria bacterium]
MDNLFYRKEKKRLGLRERISKLSKNKRLVVIVVLSVVFLSYALFGTYGILTHLQLLHKKAQLQALIREEVEQNRKLQAEVRALEGEPKTIEKVAREKYGMIREGETVYRVQPR